MPKSNASVSESPKKPSRRHVHFVGVREFDWRKATDYPPPGCADLLWWAWEFLRRNRKYQEAYRSYKRFDGQEPSQHPIRDDDVLDSYFTHPKAPKECTLRQFQEMHSETNSTVLLWGEYVRRVWLLKEPVDPERQYGDHVRFVDLRRRWKKNLEKKSKTKNAGKDRGAILVSGESEQFPFDYYTEVAPNEVLVRIRLYADDKEDIKLIAQSLKDRIKNYRKRHRPLSYPSGLHIALRVWDFSQATKYQPTKLKNTYAAFLTALASDPALKARAPVARNDDGDTESVMLSTSKVTRMLKYATDLIDGRAYGALVAQAQRQK